MKKLNEQSIENILNNLTHPQSRQYIFFDITHLINNVFLIKLTDFDRKVEFNVNLEQHNYQSLLKRIRTQFKNF